MITFKTHGKSIMMGLAAVVIAGVTAWRAVAGDNNVTPSEWVAVVLAVMGAVNVWAAANIPAFARAKTVVAAVFVVGQLVQTYVTGGISQDEWMLLIIQFLGAVGVAAAPAVSTLTAQQVAPNKFVAGGTV
jgi:hypothetical protein